MKGCNVRTKPDATPEFTYLPGSEEKAKLKAEINRQYNDFVEVPCIIDGKEIFTGNTIDMIIPYDHKHVLGKVHLAGKKELEMAKESSLRAHKIWEATPYEERFAVFEKIAETLLAEPHRMRVTAATLMNQASVIAQAEGDGGTGIADMIIYDMYSASRIIADQPDDLDNANMTTEWRPLEGFVAAITPFNYVSDAANLAAAPAVVGNTVIWKPSSKSILSNYYAMVAMMEGGLPAGVINFVPCVSELFTDEIVDDPDLAAINFIGSTPTFKVLWKRVAQSLDKYKNYPRMLGETGGKNYMFAYKDCDREGLISALIRGAYEFQGEKCSATSRAYIHEDVWADIKEGLIAGINSLKTGPASDFTSFMSAVIGQESFDEIKEYIDRANASDEVEVLCGGYDDSEGYYIYPTLIESPRYDYETMVDEIFGPILSVYTYNDDQLEETLDVLDTITPYGLTGAVMCSDREVLQKLLDRLRYTSGVIYCNEKSTGASPRYIPFGGSRMSGTNDKPGTVGNLIHFVTPRTIKDTTVIQRDWGWPLQVEE